MEAYQVYEIISHTAMIIDNLKNYCMDIPWDAFRERVPRVPRLHKGAQGREEQYLRGSVIADQTQGTNIKSLDGTYPHTSEYI